MRGQTPAKPLTHWIEMKLDQPKRAETVVYILEIGEDGGQEQFCFLNPAQMEAGKQLAEQAGVACKCRHLLLARLEDVAGALQS